MTVSNRPVALDQPIVRAAPGLARVVRVKDQRVRIRQRLVRLLESDTVALRHVIAPVTPVDVHGSSVLHCNTVEQRGEAGEALPIT